MCADTQRTQTQQPGEDIGSTGAVGAGSCALLDLGPLPEQQALFIDKFSLCPLTEKQS